MFRFFFNCTTPAKIEPILTREDNLNELVDAIQKILATMTPSNAPTDQLKKLVITKYHMIYLKCCMAYLDPFTALETADSRKADRALEIFLQQSAQSPVHIAQYFRNHFTMLSEERLNRVRLSPPTTTNSEDGSVTFPMNFAHFNPNHR